MLLLILSRNKWLLFTRRDTVNFELFLLLVVLVTANTMRKNPFASPKRAANNNNGTTCGDRGSSVAFNLTAPLSAPCSPTLNSSRMAGHDRSNSPYLMQSSNHPYGYYPPYRYYVGGSYSALNPCVRMKEGGGSPCGVGSVGGNGGVGGGADSPTSSALLQSVSQHDECFQALGHAECSLRKMETYLNRRELCDVTLIAESRRIPAHRLVLAAASDYFAAMFTNDLREASQEEVQLKDVDSEALWDLVHYCYTGQIELREDTVETLLSTACLLQLSEVVEACCGFLMKQLHPSNCIGIRLFADTQGCANLLKVAHSFTTEHFMEVIRSQEFLLLPPDEVSRLLASDDLNVPSEEIIFHAFLSWVKHDLPNRKKDLARLLGLVKLPLLSPQFIADFIETNTLIKEDRMCQDLIMEALKYHLLPERRSTLQSPRTKPRKSTVGSMYAVGGMDSNKGATSIERFDLRTNCWIVMANMTGRRLQFGVAVLDNKLYVVGGRDGLKTLNLVECYDPKTKQWTLMQPMSTHRHGLGVGVLVGQCLTAYAIGGHDGWSYLNTVERWDPQARQWSYVAPMSTQRSTVGVAVLNNRIYAVGGRDGSSCLRTMECFDPHTNKWTMCAPMAKRRGGVGVGVVSGYLYALGGHDAPASNPTAPRFDCVERYDPKTDTWTMVASMNIGRDGIGVCLMGDQLFAVGGYDGQHCLKVVEGYDAQNNEWNPMATLNTGRAGACVVVIKNS